MTTTKKFDDNVFMYGTHRNPDGTFSCAEYYKDKAPLVDILGRTIMTNRSQPIATFKKQEDADAMNERLNKELCFYRLGC